MACKIKKILGALFFAAVLLVGSRLPAATDGQAASDAAVPCAPAAEAAEAAEAPVIVDKPVVYSEEGEALARAYAALHYGMDIAEITPQDVVVHWTASSTWESAYAHFYEAAASDGTLNYASQFLVDRDGTIFRLLPETAM